MFLPEFVTLGCAIAACRLLWYMLGNDLTTLTIYGPERDDKRDMLTQFRREKELFK